MYFQEEIQARISAEERLKEAEMSLRLLDKAVNSQSHRIENEAKEEMTVNVRKLKGKSCMRKFSLNKNKFA